MVPAISTSLQIKDEALCFSSVTPVCPCLSSGALNLGTLELDTVLHIWSFTFTICMLKLKVFGLSTVLMHKEQVAAMSVLIQACNIPTYFFLLQAWESLIHYVPLPLKCNSCHLLEPYKQTSLIHSYLVSPVTP